LRLGLTFHNVQTLQLMKRIALFPYFPLLRKRKGITSKAVFAYELSPHYLLN